MARRTPPKIPRPARAPLARSREIEALWAELAALDERDLAPSTRRRKAAALAKEFWRRHAQSPVIEPAPGAAGDWIVTFLWRDAKAEEVILFANRLTDERRIADSRMRHVPGTDIWHLSYRMRGDWRASYGFLPRYPGDAWPWAEGGHRALARALARSRPDPLGRERSRNRAGHELSVVSLPDAPPQPWLASRASVAARGEVAAHAGPDGRTVWVYEPPVPDDAPLPVVIALDGEVWTGPQDLATTVDNLIDDGEIRPALVVMPHSGGPERRWAELGGEGAAAAWIADILLPWVRARWHVSTSPDDVVVAGQSLGGLTALQTALERPDAARCALSQSASLWARDLSPLRDAHGARLRVYLEVGAQEWVLREPNERLAAGLAAEGHDVHYVEYNGGHDDACWRGGIADGLRHVLAP
ncbi:MAG: DUF3327 domain-containing protein [Microbacterium sp.]|uniref:enterochelin esterase domain-containing protein n=1 Tax=Microbacterium sp. TaxID=51671 RepID=UPI0039E2B5B5